MILPILGVRWASKKAGSTTRNNRGQARGKSRGWKKNDGDYVEKGMIVYKQLGLRVYPGENVMDARSMQKIPAMFMLSSGVQNVLYVSWYKVYLG